MLSISNLFWTSRKQIGRIWIELYRIVWISCIPFRFLFRWIQNELLKFWDQLREIPMKLCISWWNPAHVMWLKRIFEKSHVIKINSWAFEWKYYNFCYVSHINLSIYYLICLFRLIIHWVWHYLFENVRVESIRWILNQFTVVTSYNTFFQCKKKVFRPIHYCLFNIHWLCVEMTWRWMQNMYDTRCAIIFLLIG